MRPSASTLTSDTNFVIARRPETENEWILGGGSATGFKHGPALAEYAARVVTGLEEPDPRFGLGPRERGTSLRTQELLDRERAFMPIDLCGVR